ncbi:cysteine-rich CWC family protein [Vibrio sp. 99-8-1]|uniref:cysteine-rich CWC family protein n=1 Tax=Vibrio sp. 99-8-1 TaxID=2607602 RepID=UPI00149343F0|nr:cysteine-rich CWC family protein [Vibrio sp. 99-8-1]NOI64700.1 cysteine-rich CWC family protein [Vibrio sp. 99-8-1]
MNKKPISIEPHVCPLCGGDNACENLSQGGDSAACWCADATIEFPQQILQTLPKEAQGKTCICKNCIRSFIATNASKESESLS